MDIIFAAASLLYAPKQDVILAWKDTSLDSVLTAAGKMANASMQRPYKIGDSHDKSVSIMMFLLMPLTVVLLWLFLE